MLSKLRNWQPPSGPQQDDITLIVLDVLYGAGRQVAGTKQYVALCRALGVESR